MQFVSITLIDRGFSAALCTRLGSGRVQLEQQESWLHKSRSFDAGMQEFVPALRGASKNNIAFVVNTTASSRMGLRVVGAWIAGFCSHNDIAIIPINPPSASEPSEYCHLEASRRAIEIWENSPDAIISFPDIAPLISEKSDS